MNNAHRFALVVLASMLALAAALPVAPQAAADSFTPITGSGSTWSSVAVQSWQSNVASNYGMQINFNANGSSAGRQDFINKIVDFAISEIPFQSSPEDGSAPEKPSTPYAYMPIVAGGTSFVYNLKIGGRQVTTLRLDGETVTKIFTGAITRWNDPQIQGSNPDLAMPDRAITPVVRSDGSGTSAQFTLWMATQHQALWDAFCTRAGRPMGSDGHCSFTSLYPAVFKSLKGSDGVTGYVSQNTSEGAITYAEFSYAATLAHFPVVKVLNSAGYFVEPTAQNVAVALLGAKIHTENPNAANYLTQDLSGVYTNADKRAYPLSSYSYLIEPTAVVAGSNFNTDKGKTLAAFANYVICEGQQSAESLGYSPLPMNLVQAGADQIKRIPGAGAVDISTCNNPTFKPGDSPSTNQLALTAPQPADCDAKTSAHQCTTPTGGVPGSYFTTHSVSGGSSSGGGTGGGGGGGSSSGGGKSGPASSSGGSAPVASAPAAAAGDQPQGVDEFGNVIAAGDDGSGAAVVGTAQSSTFTLPSSGSGWLPWVMAGAAVLFLALVALPPVLSRRLRGGDRPPSDTTQS
ncbi:phosphate ABC transporter substrate-binding protein PstS [Cellulomonas sp. McL0617]|uniref:phosphate ABC transporter substrate-binding protein PstS n=1 Tax=Cellulomonas sp. McL0617 TaxID=3415675 RepID=UPI003CEED1C5